MAAWPTSRPPRVAIVGAGPAGLATAVALRRRGVEASVYERIPVPAPAGTGLTLWPNAFGALACFGAADAVRSVGLPADDLTMRSMTGRVLYQLPRELMEERYGGSGVALRRTDLTGALLGLLEPDVVRYGARFTGARTEGEQVVASFADGSTATADLLVGADGMRSTVRAGLPVGGRLRYAGYPVWRAVTSFALERASGQLSLGRGAQFGSWQLPGGRTYWFAAEAAPEGARAGGAVGRAQLAERFASWHQPIPELIAATADDELIVTDIYDSRPLRGWSHGRVTLVGDAAHPSTPNLGQGTCQAFEDAAVLARCLERYDEVATAVRAYERLRRRRAHAVSAQARWMGRMGTLRSAPACWLLEQMIARMPQRGQLAQLDRVFAFELS
jgi:2-polyprenyl-6-methoxyphenol hydroxylase-like FAD-dependent oxidoreductase